jgi:Ca-activated chloride channel family protein
MPSMPIPAMAQREAMVLDDHEDFSIAAPASFDGLMRGESEVANKKEAAGSSLERTLESQRASGLWDATDSTLAATIAAFRVLVREGLTTSHAIYGANAKKAIDAIVAAASSPKIPASERETALLLAFLVASGRKSRAAVLDAIRAHAPAAETRTTDEATLRTALLSA